MQYSRFTKWVKAVLDFKYSIHFYFLVLLILFSFSALASENGPESHQASGPDLPFLFASINFIILVVVLLFVLKRPVKDYFAARAASLKLAVEEAKQAHAMVIQEHQAITKRLNRIEKETEDLIASFKEEGGLERKRIEEQAHDYAAKIKEDAKKITDSEVKKAKEELKEVTIAMSKELAEKIIKKEMNQQDDDHLSSSYIRQLKNIK